MTPETVLAARIRVTLADIEKVVARTHAIRQKAQTTGDDDYWDGVALNLHSFYSGLEHIFEDIARTLDQSLPTGSDWHQRLLLQMASELPHLRPAVIENQTRACLEEYRGFRHVVRNVYAFNFRPARLVELDNQLDDCHQAVQADITKFADFLVTTQ